MAHFCARRGRAEDVHARCGGSRSPRRDRASAPGARRGPHRDRHVRRDAASWDGLVAPLGDRLARRLVPGAPFPESERAMRRRLRDWAGAVAVGKGERMRASRDASGPARIAAITVLRRSGSSLLAAVDVDSKHHVSGTARSRSRDPRRLDRVRIDSRHQDGRDIGRTRTPQSNEAIA